MNDPVAEKIRGAVTAVTPPPKASNILEGDFRKRILLPRDGRLLDDFAKEVAEELRDNPIFNHGGLVMIIDEATNTLRQLGAIAFRSWLENPMYGNLVCQGRVGSGKDAFIQDKTMGEETAKGVLASHRFLSGIRKIERVNSVRMPVKRASGTIELLPEGYDEESQAFTRKTCDFDPNLSLDAAKYIIEEIHSDTKFNPNDRDRSKSVTVAMMLAPFCDLLFGPYTERPSFIVQANQEGAGKTMHVRYALAPIYGPVSITAAPERGGDGEVRKLLASIAQAGSPYIVFDNWEGRVSSQALASFITANVVSDRVLQTSSIFAVKKHCLVFITTIRANVTGELRRRSLLIDLFVEEARAEDTHRKESKNEAYILDARQEILAALWALVREWRDAGCPKGSISHPSFDEWGKTIGGIVEHAGFSSPLQKPTAELDDDLSAFTEFIAAVTEENVATVPFGKLLEIARRVGCFEFIALDEPDGEDGSKRLHKERSTLGKLFKRYSGLTFTLKNGRKINFSMSGAGHSRQYKFEPR